jgi:hypothetical protein
MNDFNPAYIMDMLRAAETPREVDAFFADLRLLSSADRTGVLAAIEAEVVAGFQSARIIGSDLAELNCLLKQSDCKGDGMVAAFSRAVRDNAGSLPGDADAWEMQQRLVCNLAAACGETAHPYVRVFAQVAGKLARAERVHVTGGIRTAVKVEETLRALRS